MKKKQVISFIMGRELIVLFFLFMFVESINFQKKDLHNMQQTFVENDLATVLIHRRQLLRIKEENVPIPKILRFSASTSPQISNSVTLSGDLVAEPSTEQVTRPSDIKEITLEVQITTLPSEETYYTLPNTKPDSQTQNPTADKITSNPLSTQTLVSNHESDLIFSDDSSLIPDLNQPTTVSHFTPPPTKEGDVSHYLKSFSGFMNGESDKTMVEYGREMDKSLYEDSQPGLSTKNENFPSVEAKEFDGNECLPVMPPSSVEWQKGNRVVTAFLPHLEPSICDLPLKCNVSTTVHRHIYLQEGDSLQVMLQRPPHLDPQHINHASTEDSASANVTMTPRNISHSVEGLNPNSQKSSKGYEAEKKSTKTFVSRETLRSGKMAKLGYRRGNKRAVDELEKTVSSKEDIHRNEREVQMLSEMSSAKVLPEVVHSHLSPLTIWKVTEHEWGSCSTREGGQVDQSEEDGVVNISDTFLPAGTQYFIGRSSWSSSECFKLKVVVRPVECGDGSICSGKGVCYANSTMERFNCFCCEGYTGRHCEERDACKSPPCLNAGICLDIQEGHDGDTFQCLCPYGYRGRLCETPSSLCDSNPCQNGGFCEGNHTYYSCHCPIGWTGPQCMEEKSEPFGQETTVDDEYEDGVDGSEVKGGCSNGPCIHGVCVETTAQEYRCFCQPGFGGDKCELEYDECYSNPCHNGGTCVDQIGTFQCLCGPGFTGETCLNKINLCEPDPCPTNKICLDKGNIFSCECLPELTNEDCGERENICSPNPCGHGGSCYTIAETLSFYCACRPGYTGQTCQGIDRYPLHHRDMAMGKDGLIFDNHKINIYGDASILESVGPYGTGEPEEELGLSHSSIPNSLLHMKNMYTGAVTLASAFLIFLLVVSVCHCRVNRPSRNCLMTIPRPTPRFSTFSRRNSFRDKRRRDDSSSLHFDCEHDSASVPMTSHGNSDAVFYNMDVCDNQELPLIK